MEIPWGLDRLSTAAYFTTSPTHHPAALRACEYFTGYDGGVVYGAQHYVRRRIHSETVRVCVRPAGSSTADGVN